MKLQAIHQQLGIPADYGQAPAIPQQPEPDELISIGLDIYDREQRLTPAAANAWQTMQVAAMADDIRLQLISAYRSIDYQQQLFERKLARGQCIEDILQVNAAPGFSEHHSGNALDLTVADIEPLTEGFEQTAAFRWLERNASRFGFVMSYPRDNPYGFIYEPWHWCYRGVEII